MSFQNSNLFENTLVEGNLYKVFMARLVQPSKVHLNLGDIVMYLGETKVKGTNQTYLYRFFRLSDSLYFEQFSASCITSLDYKELKNE